MKTLNAFVLGVCLTVAVLLAVLFLLEDRQNRSLQFENDRLAEKIESLNVRLSAISATARPAAEQKIETTPPATNPPALMVDTNISPAPKVIATAEPMITNNVVPPPFHARTFLGDKFVGISWVIPHNVRRDAKTGKIWYDQSVRLPEEARHALTAYVTNVVEVAREPDQYVEQNYYVDRRPVVWWPTVVGKPRPPHKPPVPPPSTDPPNTPGPLPPLLPPGRATPPPSGRPGIYVPPGLR